MKFNSVIAMSASLLTGACGVTGQFREALTPEPVVIRPVLPSDCRLSPTEPDHVEEPDLVPLSPRPATDALSVALLNHYITRTQRAEVAGRYYQTLAEEEADTRQLNARSQEACAAAVRALDAQQ